MNRTSLIAIALTLGAAPAFADGHVSCPVKVGVLHSLSGTMAISETTLKDTVEMLVDQQTNRVGRKVSHFYGDETCTIYKGNTGQVPTNMAHEMWRWYRAFRLLEVMNAYLKMRGVRTVNHSEHSFIDCFPRA